MTDGAEKSPSLTARTAGVFYLLIFLADGFAEFFVRGRLVVEGDAAATTANILAHESLYRLGGAAEIITLMCDIAVALLFYELFRPVSRVLSLFAAVFRLVFVAVMAADSLNYFAPLTLLGSAHSLGALTTDQLRVLASLQSYASGYHVALVFFGVHCVLIGCLLLRASFLPRIFGVLMALAGLSWLTFVWPPLASALSPYVLIPGALGEGALTLWLLARGVNAERWMEQATAA